jgi:hypothetical protein
MSAKPTSPTFVSFLHLEAAVTITLCAPGPLSSLSTRLIDEC